MDVDECLIEEVRKRPPLYDLAHAEYKNLKKKDGAWKEVAKNIKLDKTQCKKRWKGLRDSYKRVKRMEQMASGSGGATPRKCWRYSEMMSFLDNVTSDRRTIGSVPENDRLELEGWSYANSTEFSDSLSETPSAQTTVRSSRMRKESSQSKFGEFLDLAASSISKTCAAFVEQRKEQDSTDTHFLCLSNKLKEAKCQQALLTKLRQRFQRWCLLKSTNSTKIRVRIDKVMFN